MAPKVDEVLDFKKKIGTYIWVCSAALFLLWQGLVYFSDIIKAKLFH